MHNFFRVVHAQTNGVLCRCGEAILVDLALVSDQLNSSTDSAAADSLHAFASSAGRQKEDDLSSRDLLPPSSTSSWAPRELVIKLDSLTTKRIALAFVFIKTSRTAYMHYTLILGVLEHAAWCNGPNLDPLATVYAFVFGEPLHHSAYEVTSTTLMPAFFYSLLPPSSSYETAALCFMRVLTTRAVLRVCLIRMLLDMGACLLCSLFITLCVCIYDNIPLICTKFQTCVGRFSRQSITGQADKPKTV